MGEFWAVAWDLEYSFLNSVVNSLTDFLPPSVGAGGKPALGAGHGKRLRVEPQISGRGLVTRSEVATEGNGPIGAALAESRTPSPQGVSVGYGARSTMPCCLGFPQGIEFKEAGRMRIFAGGVSWPRCNAMRKLPLGRLRQGERRSWKKFSLGPQTGEREIRQLAHRIQDQPTSHRRGRHAAVRRWSVKIRR